MKKSPLLLCGLAATGLLFSSCKDTTSDSAAKPPAEDILRAHLDTTVSPREDFFQYANGGWIKANPIPADQTSWGIAGLVDDELYDRKRKINEDAAGDKSASGVQRKIADFWTIGMDTAKLEQQGSAPLQPKLQSIYAAQDLAQVLKVAADLHRIGVGVFFGEGVGQDAMNSDKMAYYMEQGGTGMPNRDYYFNTDPRTKTIREAYPAYVTRILALSNPQDSATAAARAQSIIAFETELAKSSRKLEDLRDPYANYNKMGMAGLAKISPVVDWGGVLQGIGVKSLDTVIVGQPEFFTTLSALLQRTPLPVLKDYMAFHTVRTYAPYLSSAFADANFDFYNKAIRGAESQKPRWKRVLDAQERAMGEALGQLFVKEYFPAESKKRYSDLVEAIRDAYKLRIEKLDWMSDSTKQKAYVKLAGMKKKVGYPGKWKDFSNMEIGAASFAQNMMAANQWHNDYDLAKLGKPVDRDEWEMSPQTYNAYYNPSNNEIVLPAGIFTVPGYRDNQLDDALVYGYAAASTIGHEITHGFDDQGRQFDEKGNLHNWWTKSDEVEFNKRADVLVRQFNNIVAVDSLHLNGRASLGENLADLGGLLLGADAFQKSQTYKDNKMIAGFTPMQRFFLGYALGWMYDIRPSTLASMILTDVHAPAKWRVNGPLPNVPAFYEAFSVQPGDKMYLPDSARVRLW